MFLAINVLNIIYTCIYLIVFTVSYFVILQTNFERVFKQGKIWAIRVGQVLLALAISYPISQGIMSLINSTQL